MFVLYTQNPNYSIANKGMVTFEEAVNFFDKFNWQLDPALPKGGDYAKPLLGIQKANSANTFIEISKLDELYLIRFDQPKSKGSYDKIVKSKTSEEVKEDIRMFFSNEMHQLENFIELCESRR